jgi:alkylhydroperoxidase family enzyme
MHATRSTGRLPWPIRDELGAEARRVYDRIVDGPRARLTGPAAVMDGDGRLLGPFNAMLASPAVGDAQQQLGAAIRYGTSLPDRLRELAILTVAAHRDSDFERHAHTDPARAAGLTDEDLAAIDAGGEALTGPDAVIHRAVIVLLSDRDLDDESFEAVQDLLGTTGTVELVVLVGYYDLLALSMRAFRVPRPASLSRNGND